MADNTKMQVEIWSDIACPFCYIGKRKFENALEKFPNKDQVEVLWHSFQLMPDAKRDFGVDMNTMLANRYGKSIEWAKEMNNNVANMAKEVGLEFNLDKAIPTNTLDAHRLIHLAKKHNLQDQAEEALFNAYFSQGKHIGDLDTLVELGTSIGLNADETREVLNSDKYAKEVQSEIIEGQRFGLSGVPFFVINRKYGISGAQPSEEFLKVLETAYNA